MPKKQKFLRTTSLKFSKLGKRRKKKQKWRKPTGRHNKIREKRKGKQPMVSIGYGSEINKRGKINEKTPVRIYNINELKKLDNNCIIILGNISKKNKIEISKKANEMGIEIQNFNLKKILRKLERKERENESKK